MLGVLAIQGRKKLKCSKKFIYQKNSYMLNSFCIHYVAGILSHGYQIQDHGWRNKMLGIWLEGSMQPLKM